MRQAPQLPREHSKTHLHPFLLFLLIASLMASAVTVLYRADPEPELPTLHNTVMAKAAGATENKRYSFVIDESGPGYALRFNGQVEDKIIYGKLETYDLELFTDKEKYYVKGSGVYPEWEAMDEAQLSALSVVVRDPQELLEILLAGSELLVEEGPIRTVEHVACQTYFLEIPPPDIQLLTRFEEEATLDKLQLYLWFAQDNEFLYRMALLMNVSVKGENIEINRIYSLSPRTKQLPEGLPLLDSDLYAL